MHIRDLWRLAGFLLLGLGFGLLIDSVAWSLVAASVLYIVVLHRRLNQLLNWLRQRKSQKSPEHPGIFEDLTLEIDYLRDRHKKRKKRLAAYLKQFQQATRALPDATVVLDVNGEVRWANKSARRRLGVRWPDDAGQRITNLIRQPELAEFIASQPELADTAIEIESPVDRERHLSVLIAPYGNNQRILVARDVTQLHRANQMRRDFVANVSHELRTPITVFRGYLETLNDQQQVSPSAWRSALEQMTVHADRMGNLVEQLLLLSSLETNDDVTRPTVVDVRQLIAEINAGARDLSVAQDPLISLQVDSDLYLSGSYDELYSAFSNLVFNAIHHSGPRPLIRIRWCRDDEGAHFVVEDNGKGISAEHIPRVTERFYRVDPGRDRNDNGGAGTGLGLAIVKHVLARHHATLSITSSPGKGSIFSAEFPASEIRHGSDTANGRTRDAG